MPQQNCGYFARQPQYKQLFWRPSQQRAVMMLTRRQMIATGAAAPCAALLTSAPAQAAVPDLGGKRPRIARVKTVEVRDVPTGKGLVLPSDPKKIPQDTRDYVIMQFITDDGAVGTTMDGNYKRPAGSRFAVRPLYARNTNKGTSSILPASIRPSDPFQGPF
ncbi:MAG: hypothetical protein NTU53_25115 [Planctomycetota bacterium]|nr:hypothetical protein [Planctomycetota bacterium]